MVQVLKPIKIIATNNIPKPIKKILKPVYTSFNFLYNKALDVVDILKGTKDPLVPPRSMIFVGDGDYKKTGEEYFIYFKDFASLKSDHKILDVGCGTGRMSIPLVNYLSDKGEYHGFDIVKSAIVWCNKNIATKYSNFHFEHADIYNLMYNPQGVIKSSEYKFNHKDNYFDFVFLTSVFTHMFTEDVKQYINEISRVLKPNGKCMITGFIINEETKKLTEEGKAKFNLIHKLDDYSFAQDNIIPERAIGFNETFIYELFNDNKLKITKVYNGAWCGRDKHTSFQDIIVAEKI